MVLVLRFEVLVTCKVPTAILAGAFPDSDCTFALLVKAKPSQVIKVSPWVATAWTVFLSVG